MLLRFHRSLPSCQIDSAVRHNKCTNGQLLLMQTHTHTHSLQHIFSKLGKHFQIPIPHTQTRSHTRLHWQEKCKVHKEQCAHITANKCSKQEQIEKGYNEISIGIYNHYVTNEGHNDFSIRFQLHRVLLNFLEESSVSLDFTFHSIPTCRSFIHELTYSYMQLVNFQMCAWYFVSDSY